VQVRAFQRSQGRGNPWSLVRDLALGPDGRRRQQIKGSFNTKAKATRRLATSMAEAQPGVYAEPGKTE
jgi:hypothetical protein